jgi:hypothetical protein
LPDVLDGVQFGRSRRQRHQRDVVWNNQILRAVPSGPIHQDDTVSAWRDGLRDLR